MAIWTKSELTRLRAAVEAGTKPREMSELFPKRTYDAVRLKAKAIQKGGAIESFVEEEDDEEGTESRVITLSGKTDKRITSLAELFDFFEIPYRWVENENGVREPYSDVYELMSFSVKGNSWDVTMKDPNNPRRPIVSTNYQYQVKAYLRPRSAFESREVVEQIWADLRADAENYAPKKPKRLPKAPVSDGEPLLMELALVDPHLGMLAWGKETGVPYDLDIGTRDYKEAFRHLLAMHSLYRNNRIEKVLMLVGNDLFHVDGPGFDARGGTRGGATTKGTMQDFDTRLARMFTNVRRLIVECIDEARIVASVDVQIIPGNHDRHTMYKFGEVLNAWYRNDPSVTVRNPPSVRDYYLYGANVFMFTHGEEFKRKRDNLVSVFATECPPELWVEGKIREVHVGHNHINLEKVFVGEPIETKWEGRATRVRSLPGLTPEDSWHYEAGYHHRRAATALFFRKNGGVAGVHEFNL